MKKSELKNIIREVYQQVIKETDIEDTRIPSNVLQYVDKLTNLLKNKPFTKFQQMAIIIRILNSLGVNQQELAVYIAKIKKTLPKTDESKLTEAEINKTFDKTVSSYQDLLKQKQDMIQKMKDDLKNIKDPAKKQDSIKKHNLAIKSLNKKIDDAEVKFIIAVDNLEDAEEDELL